MESELRDFGLSDKEIQIYLSCLKTGETTANRLISLTGMSRGTAYDILEKLKTRGLITSFVRGNVTYFVSNDPDVMIKTLDEKKKRIKSIISKLNNIRNTVGVVSVIEVYEGTNGVKKVLDDVLEKCSSVIVIGNEDDARKMITYHPENFRVNRIKRKIKIKNLLEESKTARKLKDDEYSEVRHLDSLRETKTVTVIYNDVTASIIMEEPIKTIKITSKEYTKNQLIFFKRLWDVAVK